jgi:hypothetical protein
VRGSEGACAPSTGEEEPSGSPAPVTPTMIAALWRAAPRAYVVAGGVVLCVTPDHAQRGLSDYLDGERDQMAYFTLRSDARVEEWLTRLHRAAFGVDPIINP